MKALEILKSYQDEIQTSVPSSIDTDEAIEELEDLQNKTCGSCKFCLEDSNDYDVWLECRCPDSPMEYNSVITNTEGYLTTDFCCNRYERKDKQ